MLGSGSNSSSSGAAHPNAPSQQSRNFDQQAGRADAGKTGAAPAQTLPPVDEGLDYMPF